MKLIITQSSKLARLLGVTNLKQSPWFGCLDYKTSSPTTLDLLLTSSHDGSDLGVQNKDQSRSDGTESIGTCSLEEG